MLEALFEEHRQRMDWGGELPPEEVFQYFKRRIARDISFIQEKMVPIQQSAYSKDLQKIVEAGAHMLTLQIEISDLKFQYAAFYIQIDRVLTLRQHEYYLSIVSGKATPIVLKTKGERDLFTKAKLIDIQGQLSIINAHLEFLDTCIKNCTSFGYLISDRIKSHTYIQI